MGRNRIARSGQDPIGRAAADREAGADYAGHAESCGCSNKLVTVRPENTSQSAELSHSSSSLEKDFLFRLSKEISLGIFLKIGSWRSSIRKSPSPKGA